MSSKDIYNIALEILSEMFPVQTEYSKAYSELILCNLESPPEEVFEIHHYLPLYDGGNNKHLVKLSPKDHIKSHALLCQHYHEIGDKERTRKNGAAVNRCKSQTRWRKISLFKMTEEEKEELYAHYDEVRLVVRECSSGEYNHFYGKNHSPESIEKALRTKGVVREGVGILKQEYSHEDIAVYKKMYSSPSQKVIVVRRSTGAICAIHHSEFNLIEFDYVPQERKHEAIKNRKELNAGIGRGCPGLPKSEEHKAKIKTIQNTPEAQERRLRINKDPVKISKTAETHRGMKRSDEAKKKMSDAKKGKDSNIKGFVAYYDPETKEQFFLDPTSVIPANLIKGNINTRKNLYYDPVTHENKRFSEGEQPEGWIRGVAPGRGNRRGGAKRSE